MTRDVIIKYYSEMNPFTELEGFITQEQIHIPKKTYPTNPILLQTHDRTRQVSGQP